MLGCLYILKLWVNVTFSDAPIPSSVTAFAPRIHFCLKPKLLESQHHIRLRRKAKSWQDHRDTSRTRRGQQRSSEQQQQHPALPRRWRTSLMHSSIAQTPKQHHPDPKEQSQWQRRMRGRPQPCQAAVGPPRLSAAPEQLSPMSCSSDLPSTASFRCVDAVKAAAAAAAAFSVSRVSSFMSPLARERNAK